MILNSQPQVSYALMDLMVKINAVDMEVFQVLCYGTLSPFTRVYTAFHRTPYHPSAHPKFLHPFSRSQLQPQPFPLVPHTLSDSSSNNIKDTLLNIPVHPHIRITKPKDTLLSTIRNPPWHHGLKCRLPWHYPRISRTCPRIKRYSSFHRVAGQVNDAYFVGYADQGPLDDPRTNQYVGSYGAGQYHAIGTHISIETSVIHLTRLPSEGQSCVNIGPAQRRHLLTAKGNLFDHKLIRTSSSPKGNRRNGRNRQ